MGSKSGSRSGSRSGSKSIVKSIESFLPKKITLVDVVIAVVIGLLICGMLSGTVEGFDGSSSTTKPAGITCPAAKPSWLGPITGDSVPASIQGKYGCAAPGTKLKVAAASGAGNSVLADWAKGTTTSAVLADNTKPCTVAGAAGCKVSGDSCVDGDGQESTKSATCQNVKVVAERIAAAQLKTGGDHGKKAATIAAWATGVSGGKYCQGITSSADSLCEKQAATKETCNTANGCQLVDCSKVKSRTGALYGTTFDSLFKCLNKKPGATLSLPRTVNQFSDTNMIPGVDANNQDHKKQTVSSGDKPSQDSNFFKWLDCKMDPNGKVTCDDRLKKIGNIKEKIEESMTRCASNWVEGGVKSTNPLWINNSGADPQNKGSADPAGIPFMGYSHDRGLVCRNPFYRPVELPGSDPRFMCGATCPAGGEGGCFSDAATWSKSWEAKSAPEKTVNAIANIVGLGDECSAKTIADNHPVWCAAHTAKSTMGDVANALWVTLPTTTATTCPGK
jgi:hypothetical protein